MPAKEKMHILTLKLTNKTYTCLRKIANRHNSTPIRYLTGFLNQVAADEEKFEKCQKNQKRK